MESFIYRSHYMRLLFKYFLYLFIFLNTITAHSIESVHFSDVIKSNGTGLIDILKNISPVDLEEYRQQHINKLVFAVDVNEASDGTEKASTQAVTVESVELHIIIDGVSYYFNDFSTLSRTIVAKSPSINRTEYFTLLGDTGSNRVSSSNSIQAAFDSTLTLPVDIPLDRATYAKLTVILLDTNVDLGDPEAFYDYSNGYEDIAIVNPVDAAYFDNLRPGYAEAPVVITDDNTSSSTTVTSWNYFPSSGENYIVAYEDLYPDLGDYDFNDLSVAYNVAFGMNSQNLVTAITGEAFLITRGATYNHDWFLKINLPPSVSGHVISQNHNYAESLGDTVNQAFTGDLILKGFSNTLFNFTDPDLSMVNTFVGSNYIMGPRFSFNVTFDTPVEITDISAPPFDPYIYVHDTAYEIHLIDKLPSPSSKNALEGLNSFKDENGFPFAMILPNIWLPPYAGVDIKSAYPQFSDYINSKGVASQNWYSNPSTPFVYSMSPGMWRW